jgi:hypothetical protein
MDGIAASREITRKFPHVRIIGLSEYADGYHADAMEKAGAWGCIENRTPRKNCTGLSRKPAGMIRRIIRLINVAAALPAPKVRPSHTSSKRRGQAEE